MTSIIHITPCVYIYIYIYIMSHHQHGYPWHALATPPYCPLLPAGPRGYILYLHRAAVCRFKLVALPLLGYVKGSIRVHHLWASTEKDIETRLTKAWTAINRLSTIWKSDLTDTSLMSFNRKGHRNEVNESMDSYQ